MSDSFVYCTLCHSLHVHGYILWPGCCYYCVEIENLLLCSQYRLIACELQFCYTRDNGQTAVWLSSPWRWGKKNWVASALAFIIS